MKTSFFLSRKMALVLVGIPFVAAWLQSGSSGADDSTATAAATASGAMAVTSTDASSTSVPAASQSNVETPAQPVSATAPGNLKLYPGTAEVVKLAQAGLGDAVILAYITNSSVRFGVNADQIVYLNDLGVSGPVVNAMMQHDSSLDAASAANPPATGPDNSYPPAQTIDDTGMTTPPPDYTGYNDDGGPYSGDYTDGDDTDYFYNSLQPYGNWVYLMGYGMCWQPTVYLRDHTWRPYCDRGRWLYTDCGWYWQSDYSWGWAAFHYGRWFCDANRGWVWRPNRVWGPAWVAWRQSGEYCGWAPLPPAAEFVPGAGFRYHNRAVTAGFDFGLSAGLYAFIPVERFVDYAPSRYVASGAEAARIFNHSQVLTGVTVHNQQPANVGMDPKLVDAWAGEQVRRAVIHQLPATGAGEQVQPDRLAKSGGSLVIYRPQLPSLPARRGTASAGLSIPGRAGTTLATTTANASFNATPTGFSSRAPTVIRQGMPSATERLDGSEAASHVQVYYVNHEDPRAVTMSASSTPGSWQSESSHAESEVTAGRYAPNSMVLIGRQNLTSPEWSARPNPTPSGTQSYTFTYRPNYTPTYAVAPDSSAFNEAQPARPGRSAAGPGSGGYPQYNGYAAGSHGDGYNPSRGLAVDESSGSAQSGFVPDANTRWHGNYSSPGANEAYQPGRQQNHFDAQPAYHPIAQPQQNLYLPPRADYSAAPQQSYSAPPRESYSAPSRENYSGSSGGSSYSSHGSSSQPSQGSSSGGASGSSRGH